MLRISRKTSPMSIGTWVLMSFGSLSAALAAAQFAADHGHSASRAMQTAIKLLEVPAALAGMAMSTYTGALLSATTSTPLWAAAPRRIAAAFGASAMASGAAALTIAERGREAPDIGPALDRIALVASAVELFLLLSLRQRLREQGVDGALDETGGASPTILVQWHSAPACRYCIILKACSNPSVRRGAHGRSRSPFSPAGSCCATCCCAPATPRQSGPRTIFI